MRHRTSLMVLFLMPCLGAAARAQGSSGSASSEFQHGRFHYNLEYQETGTGAATQRTKVFMILSRGWPDSLQPHVDTAISHRERRTSDSAAMVAGRKSRNSIGIPMGGHWYSAEYNRDSVFVLGHAYGLIGSDSVLLILVDHGDRNGGDPAVVNTAKMSRVPPAYWGLTTDPQKQTPLLVGWLSRAPRARAFLH